MQCPVSSENKRKFSANRDINKAQNVLYSDGGTMVIFLFISAI